MYEQFRNDFINALYGKLDNETLQSVLNALDVSAARYEIKQRELQLMPYEYGIPELAKTYLVCRSLNGLSKQTLKLYNQVLRLFFVQLRKSPEDVKTNDVRAWLYQYQRQHNISNRTLESYRVILHGFFSWATNEEYLSKNPMAHINPIKYTKKQRHAMQPIELEYIRQACETLRESAIIETLYSTGCRVSELAALKLSDIDWNKSEVTLFGKGAKYRQAYLNAKALVSIQRYLATRSDSCESLFVSDHAPHKALGKSGLERMVRNITARAGESVKTHVTPHVFRHTTATTAIAHGMPVQDVQQMLGHSNINTTMVYIELNQNEVKTMHAKCIV